MPVDRARGLRFGLVRRLLGAVEGEDLLAPEFARRLGKRPKTVYQWESGKDRPRVRTVEEVAKLCQAAGLPITAGWLERGESHLPPIIIPPAALVPSKRRLPVEKTQHERTKHPSRKKRKAE